MVIKPTNQQADRGEQNLLGVNYSCLETHIPDNTQDKQKVVCGYLYVHQQLFFIQLLFSDVPLLLPPPLLLSMSCLLSLKGRHLLPLLLQAALLLLLYQGAGPRGWPRQRRAGGGALTQGLPLVLYEAVLLHHHRLESGPESQPTEIRVRHITPAIAWCLVKY